MAIRKYGVLSLPLCCETFINLLREPACLQAYSRIFCGLGGGGKSLEMDIGIWVRDSKKHFPVSFSTNHHATYSQQVSSLVQVQAMHSRNQS